MSLHVAITEQPEVLSGPSTLTMLNYVDFGDREGEPFVLVRDDQVINRPQMLVILSEDTPEADDSAGCAGEEDTLDPETWLDVEEFAPQPALGV